MRLFISVLLTALVCAAWGRDDWVLFPIHPDGAVCSVRSLDRGSFVLTARRTDSPENRTLALAIGNINKDTWTHDKLVFSVRGVGAQTVVLTPAVSWRQNDGSVPLTSGPSVTVCGPGWQEVVLGLDSSFGLGDRAISLCQAKFSFRVGDWKAGTEGGVEVKDCRVCGPNEVAVSSASVDGDTFTVVRGPLNAERAIPSNPKALKVYFTFDNEDVADSVSLRKKGLVDPQQMGGFREALLAGASGAARSVDSPEEADVIVHARCRPLPSDLADRIVKAVTQRGAALYATSAVLDPNLAALLPCTVSMDQPEDLPPRFRVQPTKTAGALASMSGYSTAPFARFRTVTAKGGARTLFAFADGEPAVLEGKAGRGRVLYSALGLGTSFVPGRKARDAFFLRLLGYLTDRTLPESLKSAVAVDSEGWRPGNNGFGHFGWEVGNGFLVENTTSRLCVSKDAVRYELAAPRTNAIPRRTTFACDRINPLSVGGVVSTEGEPVLRYDGSLAYPGLLWNVYRRDIDFFFGNTGVFIARPTAKGVKIVSSVEDLSTTDWSEPWLLLWNGIPGDSPLALVFATPPATITARPGGWRLTARGERLGVLVPTWVYGSETVDTRKWSEGVPAEALARVRKWYPRAFRYPIVCRESFRIRGNRVEIRDQFAYLNTKDAFRTPVKDYAVVPPVAALLGRRSERWFKVTSAQARRELVTRYGDLLTVDGARSVTWSLPIPRRNFSLLPHATGFAAYDEVANRHFAAGCTFTCGGGTKVNYRGDRAERMADVPNLNMHEMLLGLARDTENPYIYSPENRRLLRRRLAWRLLEPLEDITYKMVSRWRREPFSGRRYTIYMNSPRDISTVYEPESLGSKIIYGDSNETVRMIFTCVQRLSDRMGQEGIVEANWDTLSREVFSYHRAIDDWAYLASGCLEWGGPGTVDMLNSECDAMMMLARLAEIAGDEDVRLEALYRAARRMCPTLARFEMNDYCLAHALCGVEPTTGLCVGFSESGPGFRRNGRKFWDCEFFDMSQGMPGTLMALYDDWGLETLRTGYLPTVADAQPESGLNYQAAAILARTQFVDAATLREKLDACCGNVRLDAARMRDWPGMDTGSYLEYSLHALAESPVLTDCRGINLHEAQYDPATKKLTLELTPVTDEAALSVNGKRVEGLKKGLKTTWTETY